MTREEQALQDELEYRKTFESSKLVQSLNGKLNSRSISAELREKGVKVIKERKTRIEAIRHTLVGRKQNREAEMLIEILK
jgi:hypothetical protein